VLLELRFRLDEEVEIGFESQCLGTGYQEIRAEYFGAGFCTFAAVTAEKVLAGATESVLRSRCTTMLSRGTAQRSSVFISFASSYSDFWSFLLVIVIMIIRSSSLVIQCVKIILLFILCRRRSILIYMSLL
jgi:hypothetical protein